MPVSIRGAFDGTAVSLRGDVVGVVAGRVGVVVTVPAAGADCTGAAAGGRVVGADVAGAAAGEVAGVLGAPVVAGGVLPGRPS